MEYKTTKSKKHFILLGVFFLLLICCIVLPGCGLFSSNDGYVDNSGSNQPAVYKIQYTDDYGTYIIEVEDGDPFSLENIPQREGYEFLGLFDSEVGGTQYVSSNGTSLSAYTDKKNIVLFPQYKAKQYLLQLDFQGASVTGSRNYTVTYGESLPELPKNLILSNKEFVGWFTEPDCGGEQVADKYGLLLDKAIVNSANFDISDSNNFIYLYAGFEPEKFTVTFNFGNGIQSQQLQIDYKLINAKLSSRDEEIKRDKAIADSQWKLKQFNIQANAQTTIDRYKQEIDSKLTDFLISVVNLFKNHVDVNQTLTCETVYQILSHVAEKLEHNTKQANEMEKVNEVMKFESNSNPQKVLEDLKNENSNFATQIQSLTNENASLKKELKNKNSALISRAPAKEWEEWAIPIYRKITNSSAKKPAAYLLRRMIQNALEPILNDDSSNPNRSSNSASISQVNNERSSRQDIKVCNLCFVAIAAIRLQKLINIFESNQDITKTKFKVGSGASIVPASQKFVRKSVESHNEM